MRIGLDIGSTTVKCVVIDENKNIIHSSYQRHYSQITEKVSDILNKLKCELPGAQNAKIAISGSAGMGLAENCGIKFVQEVYATKVAANKFMPDTDVIIELGGEDAKILFLSGTMEVRMNGSCAGGTGAFIDQMATLLNIPINEMDDCAKNHEKIYTIASRCGVFAKSDIQPLLNQGARKNDLCASIFYAVVNQTIAGLAQGREITGNVLYLGGPLTFLSELRNSFDNALNLKGICPKNSLYYVALGAAILANDSTDFNEAVKKISSYKKEGNFVFRKPLFENEHEYKEFLTRHSKDNLKILNINSYKGDVFIGIDAGSTTVKAILLAKNGELLLNVYKPNNGNPIPIIKDFLEEIYNKYENLNIVSSAVTGYGEEMIKNAFLIDFGIVETVAHFEAAKAFMNDVEFVIDIGGQDIKCFKIQNGAIDNIFLNEACSSGCGSFLQTFANALGYSINDFAKLGLFAKHPVDLGSRCTVFMNSSVKQAQKDGASIEDISAGLSLSVVKNALYKVIRVSSKEELSNKIVVQGGTFLNDAVLRAFEQELSINVVRPAISGLMGAYGAAIYAIKHHLPNKKSSVLQKQQLKKFTHTIDVLTCKGCSNNCRLTINKFEGERKYIGGNRCEKPLNKKSLKKELNIYSYKLSLLNKYKNMDGTRETIGIPMGLNMYELLPFWAKFFNSLGFKVKASKNSNRELYLKGQHTIPSDTVCFPAKLMHGHIESLIEDGVKTIFYPCMTYNLNEHISDNHYNCPVVAYYPEVIAANVFHIQNVNFINDYVGIHKEKDFPIKMHSILLQYFKGITLKDVKKAAKNAYNEYYNYINSIQKKCCEIIDDARKDNRQIIALCSRPYHADPEVNHGIDKLISSFNVAVISEDALNYSYVKDFKTSVLNQWTYHARLYAAAKYVALNHDMNLVQLVSFGCGVDAITTDEVRSILESNGKIYTQIKIDEITNLGAVKIRLRSLLAAIKQQQKGGICNETKIR